MAFCQRWADRSGGEIWANIDEAIIHGGQQKYVGRYIDKLRGMEAKMNADGSLQARAITPQPQNRRERRARIRRTG
jgi:hypothetical protein